MSQNIVNEMTFLLHSFFMGIVITFVYDGFLILRRLIRHSMFLVSLEDMVFWIACAIGVFYMLYEENNGILRWFSVFGAAVGMIVYKKSVSGLVIHIMSAVIERISRIIYRVVCIIFIPFNFLGKRGSVFLKRSSQWGKKVCKCLKNKLTGRLKLLKITLCKR